MAKPRNDTKLRRTILTASNKTTAGKMVQIKSTDGFLFDAFKVSSGKEGAPGLVILQEIFGMTDQLKSVAETYADHGFDVVLPALFDRVSPHTVVSFEEGDRGREIMLNVPKDKVLLDIDAAVQSVNSGQGVSVLGFCWGGGLALRSACYLNLTSAISFYGTKLGDLLDKSPKCPTLFHFGETDTHSPPEVIEKVRNAIPEAETYIYQAGHAFANDVRPAYVKQAALAAHERSLVFLEKHHGH